MFNAKLAAGLLVSCLIAAPAFSQSASPAAERSQTGAPSNIQFVQFKPDQWRAGDLDGVDVYNDKNEKIGDISDVILDRTGKVEAVIIGVGGFLGIGQRDVGVPFTALRFEMETQGAGASGGGGDASRSAAAQNNNAGGAPRDSSAGGATDTAPGTAAGGSAGNASAAGGVPGANRNAGAGSGAGSSNNSSYQKPQRAILPGATKEMLQNAPQWRSAGSTSGSGNGSGSGNASGGGNR
jgi:sporulation protein YlmC with PRC-barrel domain